MHPPLDVDHSGCQEELNKDVSSSFVRSQSKCACFNLTGLWLAQVAPIISLHVTGFADVAYIKARRAHRPQF